MTATLRRTVTGAVTAALLAMAVGAVQLAAQQLKASPNVNMVSGPVALNLDPVTGKIASILGDPFLRQQNEPSMACSTFDPQICLAASNDTRLVKAPGLPDGKVTGDSWLGIYWTHNGSKTWKSTVLPGFPQDGSPEGEASPLKGFDAAADPTVRAGAEGYFYVTGIAFNRAETSTVQSSVLGGSESKRGVAFIAVYRDPQQPNEDPIYGGTYIIDSGNSGQFLDKTWIAVGLPTPAVPCGPIYFGETVFTGSGNNTQSKLLVSSSLDCGKTWGAFSKVSESFAINQSANLALNPQNGHLYLTWRVFATQNLKAQSQVLFSSSSDGGKRWSKVTVVDSLGLANNSSSPDQGTLPSTQSPMFRMFRTNMYPSMCVTTDGTVWIAYSKRIPNAQYPQASQGYARIMVRKGKVQNGTLTGTNSQVDPSATEGNQLIPSIACTGTRATVAWYDQRADSAPAAWGWNYQAPTNPPIYLFGALIWDLTPPPPTHTLDIRAARTGADGTFAPSVQVSRYPVGRFQVPSNGYPNTLLQLKYNAVDWPLFRGAPFMGDYIDAVPDRTIVSYVKADGTRGWRYFGLNPDGTPNAEANESPVVHVTWADNRDVIPSFFNTLQPNPSDPSNIAEPADAWVRTAGDGSQIENWQPPFYQGITQCQAGTPVANRNQNIYASVLTDGFTIGAMDENRRIGNLRGYAIYLTNTTSLARRFRVTTDSGSFSYLEAKSTLDIDIPGSNTRGLTVFLTAVGTPPALPRTTVTATELNLSLPAPYAFLDLKGTAVLNPLPGDLQTETRGLTLGGVLVADAANTYANPIIDPGTPIIDPGTPIIDPGTPIIDPGTPIIDPGTPIIDPGTPIIDPGTPIIDPGTPIIDPGTPIIDPGSSTPTILDKAEVTQVTTTTTNTGNVATSIDIAAYIASLPGDVVWQLLVARLYTAPVTYPTGEPCTVYNQRRLDIVTNIATTENQALTSLVLAKGESAALILRFYHNGELQLNEDPNQLRKQLSIAVASQGPSTDENGNPTGDPPSVTFGNNAPVAISQNATTSEDVAAAITLGASDVDGDALTFTIVDGPSHGTLSGTAPDLIYTPAANYSGPDSFTFVANDGGVDSNVAAVTIAVTPVNDPPVAAADTASVTMITGVSIGVLTNDSDLDNPVTELTVAEITSAPAHGSAVISADGKTIHYTPSSTFAGTDTFTYKVRDAAGALSNAATVTVTKP